jgi:hypothetical protein
MKTRPVIVPAKTAATKSRLESDDADDDDDDLDDEDEE